MTASKSTEHSQEQPQQASQVGDVAVTASPVIDTNFEQSSSESNDQNLIPEETSTIQEPIKLGKKAREKANLANNNRNNSNSSQQQSNIANNVTQPIDSTHVKQNEKETNDLELPIDKSDQTNNDINQVNGSVVSAPIVSVDDANYSIAQRQQNNTQDKVDNDISNKESTEIEQSPADVLTPEAVPSPLIEQEVPTSIDQIEIKPSEEKLPLNATSEPIREEVDGIQSSHVDADSNIYSLESNRSDAQIVVSVLEKIEQDRVKLEGENSQLKAELVRVRSQLSGSHERIIDELEREVSVLRKQVKILTTPETSPRSSLVRDSSTTQDYNTRKIEMGAPLWNRAIIELNEEETQRILSQEDTYQEIRQSGIIDPDRRHRGVMRMNSGTSDVSLRPNSRSRRSTLNRSHKEKNLSGSVKSNYNKEGAIKKFRRGLIFVLVSLLD